MNKYEGDTDRAIEAALRYRLLVEALKKQPACDCKVCNLIAVFEGK